MALNNGPKKRNSNKLNIKIWLSKICQIPTICTEQTNSKFSDNSGKNITSQLLYPEKKDEIFKNMWNDIEQEIHNIPHYSFQEVVVSSIDSNWFSSKFCYKFDGPKIEVYFLWVFVLNPVIKQAIKMTFRTMLKN